jgi:shikimate dehydrogenase
MTNLLKAGVMGWPVEHSLSPRLHGYWLKKYNIAGDYVALPVEPMHLPSALKKMKAEGFRGVNLTVPHKEAAIILLDEVEPLAKRVGAVNTILVREDGSLYGRNTDVYGFAQNLLTADFRRQDAAATLLGAGGAARAGLAALLDMGFSDIRIVNRTIQKAEQMARDFGSDKMRVFAWDDPRALEGTELLANATTLGLKGQPPLAINLDPLSKTAWVTDMVYAPLQTDLLQRAAARGNKTVDGFGMLLHQARPAFAAFFGHDAEVTAELRAHVLQGVA